MVGDDWAQSVYPDIDPKTHQPNGRTRVRDYVCRRGDTACIEPDGDEILVIGSSLKARVENDGQATGTITVIGADFDMATVVVAPHEVTCTKGAKQ